MLDEIRIIAKDLRELMEQAMVLMRASETDKNGHE